MATVISRWPSGYHPGKRAYRIAEIPAGNNTPSAARIWAHRRPADRIDQTAAFCARDSGGRSRHRWWRARAARDGKEHIGFALGSIHRPRHGVYFRPGPINAVAWMIKAAGTDGCRNARTPAIPHGGRRMPAPGSEPGKPGCADHQQAIAKSPIRRRAGAAINPRTLHWPTLGIVGRLR